MTFTFDQMPSRTPFDPFRSSRRLDPYYDGVWRNGSSASWVSAAEARKLETAGFSKLPPFLREDADTAWERIGRPLQWQHRLDSIAVLDGWRTATGQQMAAFTGHENLAGHCRVTSDLFAAGLIEFGRISSPLPNGPKISAASLWRLGASPRVEKRLRWMMTCAEQLSTTGGSSLAVGHQFDRHNVLACELALRVAEFTPVTCVIGEKLSRLSAMLYPTDAGKKNADATLIRSDGLRVAVELTAATGGKDLDTKARTWAKLLSQSALDSTGVVVVFVSVGSSTAVSAQKRLRSLRKAIARASALFPGDARNRVAERMFAVSWEDWFPSRGCVSDGFGVLRALRPTGPRSARGSAGTGSVGEDPLWQEAGILDSAEVVFTPVDAEAMQEVRRTTSGLRSSPYWLRDAPTYDYTLEVQRRAGFTNGLPTLSGLTANGRVRKLAPGEVAGGEQFRAKLPPRLRF